MILEFKDLVKKYNLKVSGVIHVGAHHAEEVPNYAEMGIENIILFEPLKENFDIIRKNVSSYPQLKIRKHQVALGNSNQTITMNLSSNQLESSSILKPKLHLQLYPDIIFNKTEEVEVQKLDDYNCRKCNFLNMDVQGYELEVLKGGKETLCNIDYVYCEVNRNEVYEGNAYIEQIDEFLSFYNMSRLETFWWDNGDWGDAFYKKEGT